MKIILRKKKFNIKLMSLNKLSRINNCIKWEMEKILDKTKVKDGKPPKYEMLQLVTLIIRNKMKRKMKVRKEFQVRNIVSNF